MLLALNFIGSLLVAARRGALRLAAISLVGLGLAASVGYCQQPASGDEDANVPIFEREPYDEIELDDEAHTVVTVQPLELPDRRVPDRDTLKKSDKLIAKKIDDPTQDYEILWKDIAEVRLFEQMVLAKARELVREGKSDPRKFDEAYAYFDFLKHNYPKTESLDAGLEDYLYEDAGHWHKAGKYENAVGLLDELYRLNREYPKLEAALGATTQKIAEQLVSRGEYPAARRLIAQLKQKFPQQPIIAQFEQHWADEARQLVMEAKQQVDAGKLREAWTTSSRAVFIWPKSPEVPPFMQDLYKRYPRVVVGVTLSAGPTAGDRVLDWAARRNGRLLHRLLVEYQGPGTDGGVYACPFGPVELTDIGRRLNFRLRQGIRWSGGEQLTGFDIARRLLSLANRNVPGSDPDWSELFGGVEVLDVFNVSVDLRWTHVQPLALLETPLTTAAEGELAATVGPYRLLENSGKDASFTANSGYFDAQPGQTQEVIERYYEDAGAALHALRNAQIQVLDRLNPWDLERFREQPDIVVEQYVLPSVHCLLPNRRHPLTGHRSFRRALEYAIDRGAILKDQMLRGAERPGCQLVSGPFPIGDSLEDPLRYAYNSDVAVRPWNRRLALALAGVALHDVSEASKKKGAGEVKSIPPLVLAYPAHEPARIACKAIQRHLKSAQIPIELRELRPGEAFPPDDNYDLVYAELVGPDGIAGEATPYMVLALRQLSSASGWSAARKKLQQIHRLADDDTAVIPLWQLTEFFAYHRSLNGVGSNPVTLYQNIEQWRGKFRIPAESP
jgi:peptide/nickel transport system substrate-binding protein